MQTIICNKNKDKSKNKIIDIKGLIISFPLI